MTTEQIRHSTAVLGLALYLAGGNGALADPQKTLPQDGFFSSLKQSLKQGYDQEAVRGHFDQGSAPNVHRYYCLVDIKTGQMETNAVVGEPIPIAGGMTGVKNSAVSFYRCANAEQQGMLVTDGYVLTGPAATTAAAPPAPASATSTTSATSATATATATPANAAAPSQTPPYTAPDKIDVPADQIDIAGVKLGMSPDEVRAILRAKKLLDYNESAETLSYVDPAKGTFEHVPSGRFVNVIAAWSAPAGAAGENFEGDGESFEIMFTPVPGREKALGIVHSVGYSPANAVRESTLESGLIKKFGGFAASADLPESPTWRFQSGGNVQMGDACGRRGTFGGLGSLDAAKARGNIALKRTAEDFRSQIERCGTVLVTEDHHTVNGGALKEDRRVTRFTVTAYSPAIGLEGATAAAQLIQAARGTVKKSDAARAKDSPAPSL